MPIPFPEIRQGLARIPYHSVAGMRLYESDVAPLCAVVDRQRRFSVEIDAIDRTIEGNSRATRRLHLHVVYLVDIGCGLKAMDDGLMHIHDMKVVVKSLFEREGRPA